MALESMEEMQTQPEVLLRWRERGVPPRFFLSAFWQT
jgi:hypothetical protein